MTDWQRTPAGEWTARWQNRPVCSMRDPLKEAVAWCDHHAALADFDSWTVVGIGLGYHLFEAKKRWPRLRLTAFDSRTALSPRALPPELREKFKILEGDRLHYGLGVESLQGAQWLPAGPVLAFRVRAADPEQTLFDHLLGQVPEVFGKWCDRLGVPAWGRQAQELPSNLAVNIKSLAVPESVPVAREQKILLLLKELVA